MFWVQVYWYPDHADHVTYVLPWWDFQKRCHVLIIMTDAIEFFIYTEGCYKWSDDSAILGVNE